MHTKLEAEYTWAKGRRNPVLVASWPYDLLHLSLWAGPDDGGWGSGRLLTCTPTPFMLDSRFGFGPHGTRRCISRPCISSFCVPMTVTEAVCGCLLAVSNPWTLLLNLFTRESSSHCIARSESQQKHYYNAKHWSTLHVCDIYVGVFDAFIRLSCWVSIGQWLLPGHKNLGSHGSLTCLVLSTLIGYISLSKYFRKLLLSF